MSSSIKERITMLKKMKDNVERELKRTKQSQFLF
jgi:hypothetical protein